MAETDKDDLISIIDEDEAHETLRLLEELTIAEDEQGYFKE